MGKRAAVVICDEGQLFREGLASLLRKSNFRIHAVHSDFDAMEERLSVPAGEVLFLIGRGSASSADLQRIAQFKQAHSGSHVVLLIDSCSEQHRWEAAHCGLDGVLLKSISSEVLCLSLELVLKRQGVFIVDPDTGRDGATPNDDNLLAVPVETEPLDKGPASGGEMESLLRDGNTVVHEVIAPLQHVMVSSRREGLSDRELEILDCLVNGHSNKVIARRCNITEATVKVHLKAILRKISVANRTQAAVWAINRMHRVSPPANSLAPAISVSVSSNFAARDARPDCHSGDDAEDVPIAAVDPPAALSLIESRSASAAPALHR